MPLLDAYVLPHPPIAIPAIGRGEEKKMHTTLNAFEVVARRIAKLKPDVVVIVSPHATAYADYFHIAHNKPTEGTFAPFGAPHVRVPITLNDAMAQHIEEAYQRANIAGGMLESRPGEVDHGTLVPLYFIEQHYPGVEVVLLSVSGMSLIDHYEAGCAIGNALREAPQRVVFVASGDLSHRLKADGPYGFDPAGPRFDAYVINALRAGDFAALLTVDSGLAHRAGECGLKSMVMVSGVCDGRAVDTEVLSYEGPFGVGYAVASITPRGPDDHRCFGDRVRDAEKKRLAARERRASTPVMLAKAAIEAHVLQRQPRDVLRRQIPAYLRKPAPAFVTLRLFGALRGCVGTTSPSTPSLAEEVARNAVAAATRDARFPSVREDELPWLEIKVDVLVGFTSVQSTDSLDPKHDGIIVTAGKRCGVLLPDIEGIDTTEQQMAVARKKAGIKDGESVKLTRFSVKRYT